MISLACVGRRGHHRQRFRTEWAALTLASLLTCLVADGAAGVSLRRGSGLLVALATLPLLLCLFGTVRAWFFDEDDLDNEPNWIVPVVFVSLFLAGPISFELPSAYLQTFGDRWPSWSPPVRPLPAATRGCASPTSPVARRWAGWPYHAAHDLQ
ncbi:MULTISPECIES: hypothetical protein [Micromonospora]|uniref:Uncharacterized protein n=1 Tax=Micromonospora sicca TaxID=2202420 RepID=A0A317DRF7_9ACTN|nr:MULTISPECIES: hypothetical protein [unclassified Micromonospora]MBM0226067.1 hypothetical protein [Micromonospora sp. ATA51]PWR17319.1 hypothetical protein DKT69_00795 [Micromonospora sp. 4G51]